MITTTGYHDRPVGAGRSVPHIEAKDIPAIKPGEVCESHPSAAAYGKVATGSGYLTFCGNCLRKHEPALLAAGFTIRDERSRLPGYRPDRAPVPV